jgi:hypothetical protein
MQAPRLYEKYHLARDNERLGLFEAVRDEFGCSRGLYPGCFVHVTPSFVIPHMIYVDSDKNAKHFFAESEAVAGLITERRSYDAAPRFEFFAQDYHEPVPIDDESVDLLISQYAGFVSEHCKRYLAPGGYLIANNSHGDAGLAYCDPEFRLVAVVHRRGNRWSLSRENLGDYFVPKSAAVPGERAELVRHIRELGKGIGYTKTATDYVFEKRWAAERVHRTSYT